MQTKSAGRSPALQLSVKSLTGPVGFLLVFGTDATRLDARPQSLRGMVKRFDAGFCKACLEARLMSAFGYMGGVGGGAAGAFLDPTNRYHT